MKIVSYNDETTSTTGKSPRIFEILIRRCRLVIFDHPIKPVLLEVATHGGRLTPTADDESLPRYRCGHRRTQTLLEQYSWTPALDARAENNDRIHGDKHNRCATRQRMDTCQ